MSKNEKEKFRYTWAPY